MENDEKHNDGSVYSESAKNAKQSATEKAPPNTAANSSSKPTTQSVKALGQKARARLEEERTKRSEIKRLDPKEVSIPRSLNEKTKPKRKRPPSQSNGRKVTRKRHAPHTSLELQALAGPTNADLWVPDTSKIVTGTGTDNWSTAILLHGLPYGTTQRHIRQFFSELSIESIRIMIAHNNSAIPEWDASNPGGLPEIKRYPTSLRVVVEFDSTGDAQLAADRSGEPLDCHDLLGLQSDSSDTDKEQAAIAVTHLRKTHYQLIAQTLSWALTKTAKIRPLHESQANMEKCIHPRVREILWKHARYRLGISPSFANEEEVNIATPTRSEIVIGPGHDNNQDYTRLARQRNQLLGIAEELQVYGPFPSNELLDPSLGKDPTIYFAHQAYLVLSNSIRRLDDWLLLLRRQTLFAAHFEAMSAAIEPSSNNNHSST